VRGVRKGRVRKGRGSEEGVKRGRGVKLLRKGSEIGRRKGRL